jgi:5-methylthioadenosine/S-adenosylhomocysteine deaminase
MKPRTRSATARNNTAPRPLARLKALGLLGPGLVAVHAVHLNDEEIGWLAQHGCHVAHCPASNLKLASGFAPVARLLAAGVNVGVGTDGAASNNRLDHVFRDAARRRAGQVCRRRSSALPAHRALEMATLAGARALGMEQRIGSLEVGKMADAIAVDLAGVATQPCYDPISQLVYSAGREQVSHVWVGGTPVVEHGKSLPLDEADTLARAHAWRGKIAGQ